MDHPNTECPSCRNLIEQLDSIEVIFQYFRTVTTKRIQEQQEEIERLAKETHDKDGVKGVAKTIGKLKDAAWEREEIAKQLEFKFQESRHGEVCRSEPVPCPDS